MTHNRPAAAGNISTSGQRPADAHKSFARGGQAPAVASGQPLPIEYTPQRATTPPRATDESVPTQLPPEVGKLPDGASRATASIKGPPRPGKLLGEVMTEGPMLADSRLYLLAAQLDNAEALRIAVENRHRQATRAVADSDGHLRGLGLPADDPTVKVSADMIAALTGVEHDVELALKRVLRKHPLGAWQRSTLGVGEKQLARLLAVIGDPYWNNLHDRPRTVSELWAYCGLHVVAGAAVRRQRGERANWSATAKSRVWLIAASCIKQAASPYRKLYDEVRMQYAEATHEAPCVRCGPAGKPAQPCSPISLGHQHARGMRAMSKEVLKDLWVESRRLHL